MGFHSTSTNRLVHIILLDQKSGREAALVQQYIEEQRGL